LLAVYTPAQIANAYGFSKVSFQGVAGDGSGQTIAIVDAYYDPTISRDLAVFDAKYHLPALDGVNGRGTFTQLDLSGGVTGPTGGWSIETALDVEWAHAIAPKANILLVEAASDNLDLKGAPTDLLNAVDVAASQPGVSTVSMSWGLYEFPGEVGLDSHFTKPGVTFVAASGDSGAPPLWPAVSPMSWRSAARPCAPMWLATSAARLAGALAGTASSLAAAAAE
jgi:subtilase family serine protease